MGTARLSLFCVLKKRRLFVYAIEIRPTILLVVSRIWFIRMRAIAPPWYRSSAAGIRLRFFVIQPREEPIYAQT